jgi:hypothetical protein
MCLRSARGEGWAWLPSPEPVRQPSATDSREKAVR